MNIRLDRFLAITAVLATTGAMATGCVVEDNSSNNGGTGNTGATGATGGAGGSAGSAGSAGAGGTDASAGSGGMAGSAGSAGAAGGDAGTECLDDTANTPDAGAEGFSFCGNLPYASTVCGDPGTEGPPSGALLCSYMDFHGRLGVTEALATCLAAINVSDHCSAAHDTEVNNCISSVFPQACDVGGVDVPDPPNPPNTVTCQDVATSCPAATGGTVGITVSECQDSINAMKEQTRIDIMQCYSDAAPNTGDCADDFTACVFFIDDYNL